MTQLARCSARQEEAQTPSNAHLAFYLTGNQSRAGLNAIGELGLRPALLAPYRDLTALRYDFPLVLVDGAADCAAVQSLSGLFDSLMKRCADGPEGERLRKHALRLEREIRARAGRGTAGSLSQTWEASARHLRAHGDALLEDILKRLRAALDVDGELVDCNAEMASRLCRHLWRLGYHRKAQRFRAQLEALTAKLAEILRADFAGSEQGRSAERLRESFGSTHRDAFDFAAMSRLLAETLPTAALSDRRRARISWLLAALRSQRFFPAAGIEGAATRVTADAHGRTPEAKVLCAGSVLMDPDMRRVEEDIFEVRIIRQALENPLPCALLCPTPKPRVDGEPIAEFLRQMPGCACAGNP